MITAFLIFIMLIGIVGFSGSGNVWAIVGCVAVILLVLFAKMVITEDEKAWIHRSEYWAMSGKDRAKARHRWEAEARAEEERERAERAARTEVRKPTRTEQEEAARNGAARIESVRNMEGKSTPSTRTERFESEVMRARSMPVRGTYGAARKMYVCSVCGQKSPTGWTKELWDGRVVRESVCPYCRKRMQA